MNIVGSGFKLRLMGNGKRFNWPGVCSGDGDKVRHQKVFAIY